MRRWGIFDHDLVFNEDYEKIMNLIDGADIIHLANFLHLDSLNFRPINFRKLRNDGKIILRQLRSHPSLLRLDAGMSTRKFINLKMPSIVIGQYMERYYPKARVVPNLVPENNRLYMPNEQRNNGIYFSPTFPFSAFATRWQTKGKPEVNKILEKIKQERNENIISFGLKPLNEALKLKKRAKIVIDDIATGSYHISSLEGLSMGKPVLSYLDDRTKLVIKELSGSNECPIINVKFEEAYEILNSLLDHEEKIRSIGEESRKWMESFWSEKKMVAHYVKVYEELMVNPSEIKRQKSLEISNEKDYYFAIIKPDQIQKKRFKMYLKNITIWETINILCQKYLLNIKSHFKFLTSNTILKFSFLKK